MTLSTYEYPPYPQKHNVKNQVLCLESVCKIITVTIHKDWVNNVINLNRT